MSGKKIMLRWTGKANLVVMIIISEFEINRKIFLDFSFLLIQAYFSIFFLMCVTNHPKHFYTRSICYSLFVLINWKKKGYTNMLMS
jgi:hypothetical protein